MVEEAKTVLLLAWLTLNKALTALAKVLALAVSCLLLPAASMRKLLKLTVPLPALVPMSKVVVPCSGPVPLLKLKLTLRLAPTPVVLLLPKAS